MPKVGQDIPDAVRPFLFHGVELNLDRKKHFSGDCPWCGREGKFSVTDEKGTWGCFVCGEKGNALTFLRKLWDESDKKTNGESKRFADERGLLWSDTLMSWGVVKSVTTGCWLVPGYDPAGKLCQLYQRIKVGVKDGKDRWELRPTPTMPHAMHGLQTWDATKSEVWLHESWGNAAAFWECARQAKRTDDGRLVVTANEGQSLLADANVVAVANCGAVGESLRRYLPLFAGKKVRLCFDSDHPKDNAGKRIDGAGYSAAKRAANLLTLADGPPAEISWLAWGEDGFDPARPSGYDVRDHLTGDLQARLAKMDELLRLVQPVPDRWTKDKPRPVAQRIELGTSNCSDWKELTAAWRNALKWTHGLDQALAVMLAVALSTKQQGDQLFLQLIGEAGSAKTRLCDGMLTSKNCYPLEHLTGFHSGWQANREDGEDFSLLARINGKLLITPEGDVLMSSPRFAEIMSQQRRIFDGTSGASYKNMKEDRRYEGLRTPWIMAGTPALMNTDQSRLGDRFNRIIIDPPGVDERRDIMTQVGFTAMRTVQQTSNCDPQSIIEENLRQAYRLTGGYVDYLRANAAELLEQSSNGSDEYTRWVVGRCAQLAELTADLRARPDPNFNRQEKHDAKEMATRLTHQFVRYACCLAPVLGRKEIDEDVLLRVRKISVDTARGKTMEIVRNLLPKGRDQGEEARVIAVQVGETPERLQTLLRFMRKIGCVDWFNLKGGGLGTQTRWRLTERMDRLCREVL